MTEGEKKDKVTTSWRKQRRTEGERKNGRKERKMAENREGKEE